MADNIFKNDAAINLMTQHVEMSAERNNDHARCADLTQSERLFMKQDSESEVVDKEAQDLPALASQLDLSDDQTKFREQLYEHLRKRCNLKCADCAGTTTVDTKPWVSFNLGVVICLKCSGVHRSLGVHISKIRSVDLDNWDEESTATVLSTDNQKVNDELEYHVPSEFLKPTTHSGREVREKFIRAKYDRLFVNDGSKLHLSAMFDSGIIDDSQGASGIGMVEYTGIVFIRLIDGVNLPSMDTFSPSDPFVTFENHQKKQHCKSKTIQDDNNPKFNQNMQLCVFGLGNPLMMEVYDEDHLSRDDFIGRGFVDLSKLTDGEPHKQAIVLKDEKGINVHGKSRLGQSRINVELTYSAITR